MPLDLTQSGTTPNIEAEVASAELGVIDLIEVDFGLGFLKFWSTAEIPPNFTSSTFGTDKFEARLLEVGSRSWVLGPDDDTLNLRIGNADGAISTIAKEHGISIFEGARVKLHRLFTSIKETYEDYWVGEGLPPIFTEGEVNWDISFGIGNLRQRFGRLIEFNCPHVFAAGPSADCPYDPFNGIGTPEPKLVITNLTATSNATQVTKDTETFQTKEAAGELSVGWCVFNRTKNCTARITSIDSQTQLTVSITNTGEGGTATFAVNDDLIIGPYFSHCSPKTTSACKERGMFGKHGGEPDGVGNKRRYFGGDSAAAQVRYTGRIPEGAEGAGNRFNRKSLGNDNLSGTVIPVIVGMYRVRDIPSILLAPAGAFQHGLFIICEGEVADIHVMDVNGFQWDRNSPADLDSTNERIQNDGFWKWGTWSPDGIEDSRATTVGLARQVRRAIGRRKSYGAGSGKIEDTYGNGGVYGHPFLFNSGAGDGTSQHGLVVARIRIETQQDIQSTLSAAFDVHGMLIPLAPGVPNNEFDGESPLYNFTIGADVLRYTSNPNPIQVAYALLRDRRWGAGLPDSKIDLPAVITESNYCEEHIEQTVAAGKIVTGTINTSSGDARGTPTKPWVFIDDVFEFTGSMHNREITFNKGTDKEFKTTIWRNEYYEYFDTYDLLDEDPGAVIDPEDLEPEGNWIQIIQPFPDNKVPTDGEPVEIVGGRFNTRFKASGVMADDVAIPDMLQSVLDNCNGTFRSNGSKIEFLIRKELLPAEINTVVSNGIFTDRGVKRNIIREDGKSTMRVWREDEKDIGNLFSVEFQDQDRSYQTSRVSVASDAAQRRAADLFGDEEGRVKIPESLDLILTTTKDQAARLLTLHAREALIQNLFCSFDTSLKQGMETRPGDIIAVDSDTIASHFNTQFFPDDVAIGNIFLFRVLSKRESSDYRLNFECQVHVNPIYSDFATDFSQFFNPAILRRERNVGPANVTPIAATEFVVVSGDKSATSMITVKVTFPPLGET